MLQKECVRCNGNGQTLEDFDSAFGTTHKEWVECDYCNGEGYINEDAEMMVYVNVYSITREYGGSEEGGWWYNHFVCMKSEQVINKHSDEKKLELEEKYKHVKEGNIYSVLGGTELAVYIEATEAESETKERPQYE